MRKQILAISLVLTMVLSLTACAGLPPVQEIVDGVMESFANIRTYEFDMNMTQNQAGEAEGEVLESTLTIDISGALDLENRQMRADRTMKVTAPAEDELVMGFEMYILDGMMYLMRETPGEEPAWTKEEVPAEEMLEGISGLETHRELLETAQARVIGSEKVKGVDCYVLRLTPEMALLWQMALLGMGDPATVPEELLQEVFSDFTVKQWVAKDTYFLMRAEIDMAMELTPEGMDYMGGEGEMTMDITLSFLAYNYNQPVSIVVPPEAVEATQLLPPATTSINAPTTFSAT